MKKLSLDEVISRFKKIHGNKYDYSKVNYINRKTPVTIICPIHGTFTQLPDKHFIGHGCPSCALVKQSENRRIYSLEEIIYKCNKIHNNFYDYSQTEYTPSHNHRHISKTTIICPIHGPFQQNLYIHMRGIGCKKCGYMKRTDMNKMTPQEFIMKFQSIHGDRYDYSKALFNSMTDKIEIHCKECGTVFFQSPKDHYHRQAGCPLCGRKSKGEYRIGEYLIENNINHISQYRFKDCKATYPLPFDFYLPDYNICIEFDGIQHFKPVSGFGGEKGFNIIKQHDKIKTDYCKGNNIKIIRINYKDIDNIKFILEKEI